MAGETIVADRVKLMRALWVVIGRPNENTPDTRMVGGWIRWRRALFGTTQIGLAKQSGVSQNHLRRLEIGQQALTPVDTAVRLADALGVSREEMVIRTVYDFRRLGNP